MNRTDAKRKRKQKPMDRREKESVQHACVHRSTRRIVTENMGTFRMTDIMSKGTIRNKSRLIAIDYSIKYLHSHSPQLFRFYLVIYRMPQEQMSIFWNVIVSAILGSEMYMYMCPSPNCTVPKRRIYYVVFLIPVFIVQMTKLVVYLV
jgi:hypothetical protein